jgi:hypothetical protein
MVATCVGQYIYHVPLADPIHGIFDVTPVEAMHAFCKGMVEVVTF